MAITHGTATRTAVADAVVDRVDLGTGTAQGRLKLYSAGAVLLATLNMSNPAFGAAAAGSAAASAITDGLAVANGTSTNFTVVDRDGNVIWAGSVSDSGGGGDIVLVSNVHTIGDTVSVTALTYNAPA